MFQGVIRDDARRSEKMRQREEEFRESSRKRSMYEQVQNVVSSDQSNKN
jgi:protein PET117